MNENNFEVYIKVPISKSNEHSHQKIAYCPFHNDKQPSFSFNSETGLWKCHAGCGQGNFP